MRVIYICVCCGYKKSGVNKKILFQIEHLARNGVDIAGYSLCEFEDFDVPHTHVTRVQIPGIQSSRTIFQKLKRDYLYIEAIKDIIDSAREDDVIYLRHRFPFLKFLRILQRPRTCTVVLEFNTINSLEARLMGLYWYIIVDRLYGTAIRRSIDAIVGVTDEITQYQLSRSKDPYKPHITIGNGFDTLSVPLRKAPKYDGKELHLLFIAKVSPWHGLDRLLHGLTSYIGTPRFTLHIAGDGKHLPHVQKLTDELGLNDHVVFHGYLTGEPLDALLDRCHVAVGSLGIHRIGLKEASVLKAREYCARGIPFIYGIADPDFPSDFPYLLHLPPNESPIDIQRIRVFAEKVCADTEHPQRMREFAEEHLDWSVKMKKLKKFLETLVEGDSN